MPTYHDRVYPRDGNTKPCPQCRRELVFRQRYPLLTVGLALTGIHLDPGDRLRYVRAWVCRNGACDYREVVGDSEG